MDDGSTREYLGRVLWGPFEEICSADLDHLEETINRSLPADYRAFLLAAHGGTFPYAVRLPPGNADGDFVQFSSFTRVSGKRSLTRVWAENADATAARQLPAGLLEVAADGGGSSLYLDLRPESYGAVWAFVHGLPGWTGSGHSDMGGQVAPSWAAYVELLTIDEDYARDVWEDAQGSADDAWTASLTRWLDSGLPGWRAQPWAAG